MKCQHCGINFDDSERVCPMCGARAGSRGRLGDSRKSAVRSRVAAPERDTLADYVSAKARPSARRAKASAKPIRERSKAGKKKGKVALVVAALVVLINFLPALTELFDHFADQIGSYSYEIPMGEAQEDLYYVPGETYPYDADDYRYVSAALYDLTGPSAAATLSDGAVLLLEVQPGTMGDYTLAIQDSGGTYSESGYTWCSYHYPEEQLYSEAFPPDRYDCFTMSLTVEDFAYEGADGAVPERYMTDEYGDHWFFLYFSPETGEVVLEDIDQTGIFGADAVAQFVPLENS